MKIPIGGQSPVKCQHCSREDRQSLNTFRRGIWIECDCGAVGCIGDSLARALGLFRDWPVAFSGRGGYVSSPPEPP